MEDKKVYVALSFEIDEDRDMIPGDLVGVFSSFEGANKACLNDMKHLMETIGATYKEVGTKEEWAEDPDICVMLFRNDDGISGMDYHIIETTLDDEKGRVSLPIF